MQTSARNQFLGTVRAIKRGAVNDEIDIEVVGGQMIVAIITHLSGTVSRLHPGAVNTEVVIGLPGGGGIAAIITNDSAASLGLAEGLAASAIFKAGSVIVGVPPA